MDDEPLTAAAPSVASQSNFTAPADFDLTETYRPRVIPTCTTLTITKRFILNLAVEKLGVTLHQIQVTPMDNDDLLGSVSMDVPPHREHPYISKQVFWGDYTPFPEKAIESACSVALAYLQKTGILVIDDANYADLKICQAKLQESQFWEDLFRTRAEMVKPGLPGPAPEHHHIVVSDGSDTDDDLAIAPPDPIINYAVAVPIMNPPINSPAAAVVLQTAESLQSVTDVGPRSTTPHTGGESSRGEAFAGLVDKILPENHVRRSLFPYQ